MKNQQFNVQFTGRAINFDSSPSFFTRDMIVEITIPAGTQGPATAQAIRTEARAAFLAEIDKLVAPLNGKEMNEHNYHEEALLLINHVWRPEITVNAIVPK